MIKSLKKRTEGSGWGLTLPIFWYCLHHVCVDVNKGERLEFDVVKIARNR